MNRWELDNLSNSIIREETKKILNTYDTYGINSKEAIEAEETALNSFHAGDNFIRLAKQIYSAGN
jgi:hypothetical protein